MKTFIAKRRIKTATDTINKGEELILQENKTSYFSSLWGWQNYATKDGRTVTIPTERVNDFLIFKEQG